MIWRIVQLLEAPTHGIARMLSIHYEDITKLGRHGKVGVAASHGMQSKATPGWQLGLMAHHLQTKLFPYQLRAGVLFLAISVHWQLQLLPCRCWRCNDHLSTWRHLKVMNRLEGKAETAVHQIGQQGCGRVVRLQQCRMSMGPDGVKHMLWCMLPTKCKRCLQRCCVLSTWALQDH